MPFHGEVKSPESAIGAHDQFPALTVVHFTQFINVRRFVPEFRRERCERLMQSVWVQEPLRTGPASR